MSRLKSLIQRRMSFFGQVEVVHIWIDRSKQYKTYNKSQECARRLKQNGSS